MKTSQWRAGNALHFYTIKGFVTLQLSSWFAVWLSLDLESDLFMNWKNIACSIFKSSIQIILLSGWHPSKDTLSHRFKLSIIGLPPVSDVILQQVLKAKHAQWNHWWNCHMLKSFTLTEQKRKCFCVKYINQYFNLQFSLSQLWPHYTTCYCMCKTHTQEFVWSINLVKVKIYTSGWLSVFNWL